MYKSSCTGLQIWVLKKLTRAKHVLITIDWLRGHSNYVIIALKIFCAHHHTVRTV